uniref:Uncharacterized protein n=1 Tax=Rhodnius prolixus TaxID=13249 RepID=T1I1D8_RHOPR
MRRKAKTKYQEIGIRLERASQEQSNGKCIQTISASGAVASMKQCVFIIDDRTQSMPIQSIVDVEAISSSTCIISTACSCRCTDTVVDPLAAAFILLRP